MKKLRIFSILFFASIALVASAHDYIIDGDVSLVIHIEPGHQAIVGRLIIIDLNLADSEKGFSIEKCKCEFSIEKDEKQIFSTLVAPLANGGDFNVVGIPFTFPEEGEYHLSVKGTPLIAGLFTSFTVESQEEVLPLGAAPLATHVHSSAHIYILTVEAILFTILMAYFLFANRPHKLLKFLVPHPKRKI